MLARQPIIISRLIYGAVKLDWKCPSFGAFGALPLSEVSLVLWGRPGAGCRSDLWGSSAPAEIRLEREHTARCQALGVAPSAFVEGVENIVPHLNRWLALGSSENPSGDCSGQVRTFQQTSLSGRASVCLEPVKVSNKFVTRWWLNPLIEFNFSLEYNSQNLLLNVSAWSCTHFRGFEWNK